LHIELSHISEHKYVYEVMLFPGRRMSNQCPFNCSQLGIHCLLSVKVNCNRLNDVKSLTF